MSRIMVVDDDPYIRELLHELLKEEGFEVLDAADGLIALSKLECEKVDMMILDIMMPGMDGWKLCEEIRSCNSNLPILMLTAKGKTSQKVKGFTLGADDYLVKPFEPAELVARVKALLKRCHISMSKRIQIGNIEIDKNLYVVIARDKKITLPVKEFELLFSLASYPGKIIVRIL